VKLHEAGRPALVDQAEGVDAEALHHPQAAGNGPVGHHPHDHVHRFRHERDEVPEGVVRRRRLRHLVVRLGLHRVDQVGKLDGVLDEEDRDIVPDEVEIPLLRVELDGEAADVTREVARSTGARHRREANEDGRPERGILKELGLGVPRERLVDLEVAMGARAAGMDHALGNPLVIEVGDLLAEDEVLEERRPSVAGFQ
jgi:hypothetical protein